MPKTKADYALRRAFAVRAQLAIRQQYATLYAFGTADSGKYAELAKRAARWLLPQTRPASAPITDKELARVVIPDGPSLVAFARAVGVSVDWLLGLDGTDDTVQYVGSVRESRDLAEALRLHVLAAIQAAIPPQVFEHGHLRLDIASFRPSALLDRVTAQTVADARRMVLALSTMRAVDATMTANGLDPTTDPRVAALQSASYSALEPGTLLPTCSMTRIRATVTPSDP